MLLTPSSVIGWHLSLIAFEKANIKHKYREAMRNYLQYGSHDWVGQEPLNVNTKEVVVYTHRGSYTMLQGTAGGIYD